MDPNATYRDFLDCYYLNEIDDALEHGRNLVEWLDKGGFEPAKFSRTLFYGILRQLKASEMAAR